ncbi:hypothetical protein ACS0TY_029090 [Phlomoides rotata]
MGRPHVLAIPYPAQGHVIPLMELAQCLAKNGIKVTFVNSEFNHGRIMKALSQPRNINELISLASIPDGLEPWEDRHDMGKVISAMSKIMPEELEALIENINETDRDKITCVITDYGLTWVFELADKLRIKKTSFISCPVAVLALTRSASKLFEEGIIDIDGTPQKQQMIHLSPEMPAISTSSLIWTHMGDLTTQKLIFQSILQNTYDKSEQMMDWILCNSSYELEPGALKLVPQCVPIGPLLASNRLGQSAGNFWTEDSASLQWLHQQPPNSTIYVAFGSSTFLDETQFQELALGLELTNKPFLWVVRQDLTQNPRAYPEGFEERIRNRGEIVEWAPQQEILSHPSVACFLSHCGWNSTLESVSNGVPLLCWPYYADQFLNEAYISDFWKVGLGLEKDEGGIVTGEEIRKKVEILVSDETYKNRAVDLQSKAVSSGRSRKNFSDFVDWIKEN